MNISRRHLIGRGAVLVGGAVGVAALAGCGETQIVTETRIQEVVKEVPVERVVTRIVEKEVVVEKVVEVEKVVTQLVEREKIVEKIVEVAPKKRDIAVEVVVWNHQGVDDPNRISIETMWKNQLRDEFPRSSIRWEVLAWYTPEGKAKLDTAIASGNAPDVLFLSDVFAVEYATKGLLVETPKWLSDKLKAECVDTVIDGATVNGKVMAVPCWLDADPSDIAINIGLAEKAGLPLGEWPKTWDELGEWGAKGAIWDGDAMSQMGLGMGIYENQWIAGVFNRWAALLKMSGGKVLSDGDSGTVAFNSGAGANGLQIYHDLYNKYKVADTKFINDLTALLGNKGTMAMASGNWERKLLEEILTPPELIGKLKLDYFPLPGIDGPAETNASMASWGVFSQDPDKQEASWLLLDALHNYYRDAEKPIGAGNYVPWHHGGEDKEPWTSDAHWLSTIPVLKRSSFLPRNPTATKMMEQTAKQILAGVSGNKSIQETLDKMETAATDAL
jgi:ABC-type glycerol-3-phosphate transport system substrate-binding protein/PII-like signaling protein